MKPTAKIIEAITAHAAQEFTRKRECCGLVIVKNGKQAYVPCKNRAQGDQEFVIDEADWAAAEDIGGIVCIVHSHVGVPPLPSQADMVGIENTQLPWLIMNMPTGQHCMYEPSGYQAPLIGRVFQHGVLDCYSLIRDYYQTLNISLPDFKRDVEWWRKGHNLYRDNFSKAGFSEVSFDDLQPHDVIFMRLASVKDNHGAIYLGDNIILHHPMTRLSSRDVFGGYWRKIATGVVRHEAFR